MKLALIPGMLAMTIVMAGCQETTRVCDPGLTQECLCRPSVLGVQVCVGDGTSWGVCQCDPLPDGGIPPVDADHDGEVDADRDQVDADHDSSLDADLSQDGDLSIDSDVRDADAMDEPDEDIEPEECEGCHPGDERGSGCEIDVCNDECEWEATYECAPGDHRMCDGGGREFCLPSCEWSDQCCALRGDSCDRDDDCCPGLTCTLHGGRGRCS